MEPKPDSSMVGKEIEGVIFVNFTNHPIGLWRDNNIISLDPSPGGPYVKHVNTLKFHVAGFEVFKKNFLSVENEPEVISNTYYIVSSVVAKACKRTDMLVPKVVRDQGKVFGCNGFYTIT